MVTYFNPPTEEAIMSAGGKRYTLGISSFSRLIPHLKGGKSFVFLLDNLVNKCAPIVNTEEEFNHFKAQLSTGYIVSCEYYILPQQVTEPIAEPASEQVPVVNDA